MWGAGRLSPPTPDPSFDNQVRNPLNSEHGDSSWGQWKKLMSMTTSSPKNERQLVW